MPIVPIVAILAVIVLPLGIGLIAILTEHQRKMAEILHQSRGSADAERLHALERQISELTALVHQQTIAIDSLTSRSLPTNDRVEQRLG